MSKIDVDPEIAKEAAEAMAALDEVIEIDRSGKINE